jgi:CheY-like chemotaxis protein
MNPSTAERIFDPYFTTKDPGEGTGLGLAVVDGIVRSHKGAISLSSRPDEGTTFTILFPRTEPPRDTAPLKDMAALPTGSERILFVDDEKTLAEVGKQMLTRLGYKAVTTTSSIQALEWFHEEPDRFDVVITDMTMPHLTGEDLAREFFRIRPDVPIILCTGFSERITEEKATSLGIRGFIMKPLLAAALAKKIREVLDQNR